MRARVGDLAIARFDNDDDGVKDGNKYQEEVCIVTGIYSTKYSRDYNFIYWDKIGRRCDVTRNDLPRNRLVRVRPKKKWNGVLSSITLADVEPV